MYHRYIDSGRDGLVFVGSFATLHEAMLEQYRDDDGYYYHCPEVIKRNDKVIARREHENTIWKEVR